MQTFTNEKGKLRGVRVAHITRNYRQRMSWCQTQCLNQSCSIQMSGKSQNPGRFFQKLLHIIYKRSILRQHTFCVVDFTGTVSDGSNTINGSSNCSQRMFCSRGTQNLFPLLLCSLTRCSLLLQCGAFYTTGISISTAAAMPCSQCQVRGMTNEIVCMPIQRQVGANMGGSGYDQKEHLAL